MTTSQLRLSEPSSAWADIEPLDTFVVLDLFPKAVSIGQVSVSVIAASTLRAHDLVDEELEKQAMTKLSSKLFSPAAVPALNTRIRARIGAEADLYKGT